MTSNSIHALVLAAALCGSLTAAQSAQGQATDPVVKTVLRPSDDAVIEVRTLAYRAANGADLPLDLYYDRRHSGPRPILILISGNDDPRAWGSFRDFGRLAAERGFTAIIPVKRLPRGPSSAETGQADILALINQLPRLAADVADAERTCLWAFSAGGSTLSVAYRSDAPKLRCVVGYYPILSFTPFAPDRPDWVKQYSPAHIVEQAGGPHSPPALVIRAGKDSEPINRAIAQFMTAAMARNLPLTLINLPDARHGFDFLDDADWSRDAMERSFDFAKLHTRPLAE